MEDQFKSPVFDVSNMDAHELGHLEYVLNSPSWQRVFRPFIERLHQQFIAHWLDPRGKTIDEQYLKAGANVTRDFLSFFEKVIKETNHERAMQARTALGDEDLYRLAREQGQIGPAGQVRPNEEY